MTSNTAAPIEIKVLLFAGYREALGQSQLSLQVPGSTTAGEVFQILSGAAPALDALRPYTSFAVNREVCPPEHVLRQGDEVAFLQPVSGGADD